VKPTVSVDEVTSAARIAAALIETTTDAVVTQDAAGLITGWNTAAERIFGVHVPAALGTSFSRFLDIRTAQRWPDLLIRVRSGERVELPSVILQREGGLVVHGTARMSPLRGELGAVVGSLLVVSDRTEEIVAQQTLAAAEEQVRRSENLARAGSFVIDGYDQTAQWSDGMYRIYGADAETFDPTRASHLALVHPDDRAQVGRMMSEALEKGIAADFDHRLTEGAEDRWVFLAVQPVLDGFGRVTGISGICLDVSERIAAEIAVRDALLVEQTVSEELRRIDGLKDDFLATVSHELRTPLTSIGGYAGLLSRQRPELGELVGPIVRNSAEMLRMVESLLDFCRLQAGQVSLRIEPVAIARLVDESIPAVAVSTDLPDYLNQIDPSLLVNSDGDALRRILGNLLTNAARYAGSGARVSITARPDDAGSILLSVADDGPGIAAEYRERLFERFFQVPGAATRRGTGIGLAIVKEYVKRLGGTVWCDETPGGGATFMVRLP
jgi:PAS domain S-box-containing protein